VDANKWTLAWISIALAVGIMLLARLPRRALVFTITSVIGAVAGAGTLATRATIRICDFLRPVGVDRCSGTYLTLFGEHRLPQFMQTSKADAWLVALGALLGIVLADLFAVGAMWVWSRVGRNRSREVPQRWFLVTAIALALAIALAAMWYSSTPRPREDPFIV
jgi:hypothetical protein